MPGCVEPSPEPDISFDYESSTVELRIFHGETIDNATAFFNITIELNHELAPVHARNFHSHVEQGNYNVTTFHRIIDNFMIQEEISKATMGVEGMLQIGKVTVEELRQVTVIVRANRLDDS